MVSTLTREEILKDIDALGLSPRLQKLRARYFDEAPQVCSDRLKYAMQSLKETEGEPLEIRCARKLKAILDGMRIVIHDDELTAGNQSRFFRGCAPYIDWNGEYFDTVVDGEKVTFGGVAVVGSVSDEDWQACKEAGTYFRGRSPSEAAARTARMLWGDWYDDAMEARAVCPRYEDRPYFPGVPMWEELLRYGLGKTIADAEAGIASFREGNEHDPEKVYFWEAAIIACQALIDYARRHAKLAREMASEEPAARRQQELEQLAEACEWAPENPARTFQEAIQALRLAHVAVLLENGRKDPDLGRMDQYLYPYFRRDIDEGRLALEKARDLLGDFITYVARIEQIREISGREAQQTTMISHITLGGTTRGGDDASNELTYLILHTLGLLGYAEPHSTIRLHEGTPFWLRRKALETNQKVNGNPMYVNDGHITQTIHQKGVSLEEARDWGIFGCSQPVVPSQGGHYHSMHFNAAVPLDLALHNGVSSMIGKKIGLETGDPRHFRTFEEMFEAFRAQYEFLIKRLLRLQRTLHLVTSNCFRSPLLSALDPATVRNGKSHLLGGSQSYPLWHMKDRALVDAADSLTAIQRLVFDERRLSMSELLDAIDSDFAGERGEEIRQMCLAAPKYGNDIDEADRMLRDVGKLSANVILSEKNCFGQPYSINRNGVALHYALGKAVGALPNGRKARAPFADGSLSPMNGRDKNGLTAVLNSALKADFTEAMLGILNQKFPLTLVKNPEAMSKIDALTTTFIKNGGLHIQYNFVDRNVLLDAKKHPERYKDLVVRVAGYSAYFVNLTPEVQDEIINRTEQSL
ncbi:MAG: hypothetical protein HYX92_03205 [Chloroflexi bacterium]|nr:hypothetical protein [Chloroflexota bacterium]